MNERAEGASPGEINEGSEIQERAPEDVAAIIRADVERIWRETGEEEVEELIGAVLEGLDETQQETVRNFLERKREELLIKTGHPNAALEGLIGVVKLLAEEIKRNPNPDSNH